MSPAGWLEDLKSAQGRQAALAEYGPRVAVLLLGGLIAIQAGFLVTGQNTGTPAASWAQSAAGFAAAGSAGTAPTLRLDSIVNAHLFGEARSAATDDAPQTSAPLVLAGVLAVPDPMKGMAIIGPNAGTAKLYAVGAAVPGGVRLHAVYNDRVLLDRNGVLESLLLPKKRSSIAPPPVAAMQSPAQRLAALAQSGGPGLLGGLVRAQAVFSGGKLSGYRIFPGGRTNVAAFTQLGLRPGDLVTAVNGTPLDDPNRANDILQTLSSVGSANVTVLRNGQSQDINLNLEAVASDAENAASQGAVSERRGGAFGGPLGGPLGGGAGIPGMRGSVIAPVPTEAASPPPPEEPSASSEQ
jgi:general secretion pathway protein C